MLMPYRNDKCTYFDLVPGHTIISVQRSLPISKNHRERMKNQSFQTKCVHSGIEEYEFGSVVPPIYQTSTFKFKSAQHGADLFAGKEKGYIYTRMLNPTIEAMENAIAELEGGHKALGCGSGMAAVHTIFAALLSAGDHVVC